jgi:hypothetical protein
MPSKRKSVRKCSHQIPVDRYCYLCDMNDRDEVRSTLAGLAARIDMLVMTARRLDQIEAHLRDVFIKLDKPQRQCPWCGIVLIRKCGLSELSGRIHVCPGEHA